MPQVNLLRSLPKTKRKIEERQAAKDEHVIAIARWYGMDYFDGDRKYGYGGYRYDGRWAPVAFDICNHFGLRPENRILDVGCAKGFLVRDLKVDCCLDAYGLDISKYALKNCHPHIIGRLHLGSATHLPFPDNSFDAVISINTIHNLTRRNVIRALQEIERVAPGRGFVQVDSYYTPQQKALFEDWVLTAKFHDYPEGWLKLFTEAGYTGDYDWTIIE